jgi:hypothetical protein
MEGCPQPRVDILAVPKRCARGGSTLMLAGSGRTVASQARFDVRNIGITVGKAEGCPSQNGFGSTEIYAVTDIFNLDLLGQNLRVAGVGSPSQQQLLQHRRLGLGRRGAGA